MEFDKLFQQNIAQLQGISSALAENLLLYKDRVTIEKSSNGLVVICDGEIISSNIERDIAESLGAQLQNPDGISLPLISQPGLPDETPGEIVSNAIHSRQQILLQSLVLDAPEKKKIPSSRSNYKTCMLLGSLAIVPLLDIVIAKKIPAKTIILVESNLSLLAAVLHLYNFSEKLLQLKSKGFGFHFIYEENYANLRKRILERLTNSLLISLHGMQILRSPNIRSELLSLRSWLHSPDELPSAVTGILGFTTDELNQSINTLSSLKVAKDGVINLIDYSSRIDQKLPIVIVASGPSLDDSIEVLSKIQNNVIVVSCGSSLGSLIRAGIKVDYTVILERNAETYYSLIELVKEYPEIQKISLLSSVTVDPRIPGLFQKTIFFSRPYSVTTAIFPFLKKSILPIAGPQVVNAALEIFLILKAKSIVLLGCDLSSSKQKQSRSINSYGLEVRKLSIPDRGSEGRTVFTSPDLLYVRSKIESVLMNNDLSGDSNVYRIGEGLPIKNTIQIDSLALQELVQPNKNDIQVNSLNEDYVKSIQTPIDFKEQLNNLHNCLALANDYIANFENSLELAEEWDDKLYCEISTYVSRYRYTFSNKNVPYTFFTPLFFYACQSLYVSDSADSFKKSLVQTKTNIKRSHEYFKCLFQLLIEIAESDYPDLYCDKGYLEHRSRLTLSRIIS